MSSNITLRELANCIRFLSADAIEQAKSGHPGLPLGMADVATCLYSKHLRYSSKHPLWSNRDRLVLSAGHGSMLLYSLLYLSGYESVRDTDLKNFRKIHQITAGHPEFDQKSGIETTTGPLGQGLANAVGMALAAKVLASRTTDNATAYKVYVIAGDGCLMEGISQEAISFAGHYGLNNLIVLFDDNGISIDGSTSLSNSDNHEARFTACGWRTRSVDGHDFDDIDAALEWAQKQDKPVMLACKTKIGFGAPDVCGTAKAHGSALGAKQIEQMRKDLDWPYEPFHIPEKYLTLWRSFGSRHHSQAEKEKNQNFAAATEKTVKNAIDSIGSMKAIFMADNKPLATRLSSGMVIEKIISNYGDVFIGGSADLTPSNLTKTKDAVVINKDNYDGSYIHYGIREHGMAAIMNGLSASGFRTFGGTFLAFSDYLRPALRLSALMEMPVIYVMTHDSIGLGEDGPTHQPVEHLAALRAIPNLQVIRPMDSIETIEAWQIALSSKSTPTVLALSRQNLPIIAREARESVNMLKLGGYVVIGDPTNSQASICASGSEVEIAINTHKLLLDQGIRSHVVSMPWVEGFLRQDESYRQKCLPKSVPKFVIEAATGFGWDRIIQGNGLFFGLETFGLSAPYEDIYNHFGLNPESITAQIKAYTDEYYNYACKA